MVDSTPPPDRTDPTVCPWCSATVTAETETCPSCGAVLLSDGEPVLPGVTAVDDKVLRGETRPQPRSRLLSWISGEYPDEETTPVDAQAIAPPDPEVQREIRRLAIEAEVANLTAEVEARRIEAVVEQQLDAEAEVEGDAEGEVADVADEAPDAGAVAAAGAAEPTDGAPESTDVAAADSTEADADRPTEAAPPA